MASSYNGRVDVLANNNYDSYNMFEDKYVDDQAYTKAALKNVHINNPVSTIFFGRQNVEALQEAIRYQVYSRTPGKHIIDKQSETEIYVVMRAMYLQHAQHKSYDIIEQVRALNGMVLDYIVPKVISEINLYLRYKKDISQLPIPMERGMNSSTKGTKVLLQKDF